MNNVTRILAYLDDELDTDDKNAFEAELSNNPELKDEFEFYRQMMLTGEVFGPDGVKEQLDRVWLAENRKNKVRRAWQYAAAIALLMVAGVLLWQNLRPKNAWNNRAVYAQLLDKQRKMHKNNHITDLDAEIVQRRGSKEVLLPALDTLIAAKNEVLFRWNNKNLQGKVLELEVFTKGTRAQGKRWVLPQNKTDFSRHFAPGFYYWRLNIKDEETVGFGRFYVVD